MGLQPGGFRSLRRMNPQISKALAVAIATFQVVQSEKIQGQDGPAGRTAVFAGNFRTSTVVFLGRQLALCHLLNDVEPAVQSRMEERGRAGWRRRRALELLEIETTSIPYRSHRSGPPAVLTATGTWLHLGSAWSGSDAEEVLGRSGEG